MGTLASGGTATLGLAATVNTGTAGTTILNKAFVSAVNQRDNVPGNNRDSVAVLVVGSDLVVTKVVDRTTPIERDTLTYTVTVRNNGPSLTGGVSVDADRIVHDV